MRILLLVPILLMAVACTVTDPVDPYSTTLVEYYQDGQKLHMKINSSQPTALICHERGNCLSVTSTYFGCVSMSVDPGETITVTDGIETALIKTDP